jgi:hypothetical protein
MPISQLLPFANAVVLAYAINILWKLRSCQLLAWPEAAGTATAYSVIAATNQPMPLPNQLNLMQLSLWQNNVSKNHPPRPGTSGNACAENTTPNYPPRKKS